MSDATDIDVPEQPPVGVGVIVTVREGEGDGRSGGGESLGRAVALR